jgi:hypothetical protein
VIDKKKINNLMLRLTLDGGGYAHMIVHCGSRPECERTAWGIDLTPCCGPGVKKAELIIVDDDAWEKIKGLDVCMRPK